MTNCKVLDILEKENKKLETELHNAYTEIAYLKEIIKEKDVKKK